MASITITVPPAQVTRTLDGVCGYFQYQATMRDGSPNPETKAAFVQRMVALTIKNWVSSYESQAASDTAAASVQAGITPS